MGVRNVSAGATVKSEISKEIPDAQIDVLELDLSSMDSVRKFASDFKAMNLPLNILMSDNSFIWNLLLSTNFFLISPMKYLVLLYFYSNNAGVMATPFLLSEDGIELQFATNHVGRFLL
jgi:WW domain-containing oxidoreductase